MWKREEPVQPVTPPVVGPIGSAPADEAGSANPKVVIGKSIVVKGELSGSEDLTVEGQVEGKIALKQHVLTVGVHGRIRAQVFAKSVVVLGEVIGNIEATEKVAIRNEGTVEGDINAPRVAIAEGAKFRGGIDMQQGQGQPGNGSEPKAGSEPRRSVPAVKAGSEPRRPAPAVKAGSESRSESRRPAPTVKAKSA